MRGIVYQFSSFESLSLQIEAGGDEQDLELPPSATQLSDGEWVLAQIRVGEDSTSIAACVVDRGGGLRLAFEDRDWQRLWQFANSKGPPTIPPASVPPPSGDVETPPGTRILIVDDETETQQVLTRLLETSGYSVAAVGSAEAAFDTLRSAPVDLTVVDWNLPGMTGLDFCRRVRKDPVLAAMPIFFVTANASSSHLVQAFEAGADDYLTKPFRAPELRARMLGLLRRSKMQPHVTR